LSAGGFGVVYLAVDNEGQQVAVKEYLPSSLATRAPASWCPGAARKAVAVPPGPEELLRRRPRAGADLAPLGGQRAELLPRERNRLHGDELPGGRDPAGFHHHRARPEEAEGVPRIHHPLAVRRDPARLRIVHQHKMLHLDIKPANIFITDDNKA
jgi:serine/threonine protein kinase